MKFFLVVDKEKEPSVTVVCDKVTRTVAQIEALCKQENEGGILYGYDRDEIFPLELEKISCFYTQENKVFARINGKNYVTKLRIKQVVEIVDDTFIKINQGCVVRVDCIKKFAASFGGSLRLILKDGYSDYVSRRELPQVKRRFGL